MKLHIANFYDAPRHTAFAGEDIDVGAVIKISAGPAGERLAHQVTDADAAQLVAGKYGVAAKINTNPLAVSETLYGVPEEWGSRVATIKSGDAIVQVAPGAILEFDPSLLHDSLNPAEGGTLPVVGAALAVKAGKFAAAGTGGAIASPVVARVFDVLGGKVRIELV